jgi:hypothetical protein
MPRKRFPRGHAALVLEGFVYLTAGICRERECGASVLWYRTPNGKRMPIDFAKKIPHFWCCPVLKLDRLERHGISEAPLQFELFPW